MQFNKDGCFNYEKSTLQDLHSWYAAHIMERLIEDGGNGLRAALWQAMDCTLHWKEVHSKKKNK